MVLFCTLVGPLFPPSPAPCLLFVSFLGIMSASSVVVFSLVSPWSRSLLLPRAPACAPCPSSCYPCLAAPRPLTRPSSLLFSVTQPTLPVRLPSLSVPRCHSCVPPACSTPAPLHRPYPSPWCLSHPSVPSVPVSHLILDAMCPVCGGGVSADWTLALPENWHEADLLVPTHHEPPHLPKVHRENDSEKLVEFPSLHLHCGAWLKRPAVAIRYGAFPIRPEPRIGGLTRPGHQGFTLCCITSQVFHGADGHQGPAHSGSAAADPSEQGTRKSNGINAAPSCHAESFVAM